MVEFGRRDIALLTSMTLAVIVMSFTFPALGMTTTDNVSESDVPQYNASASSFDFAGDFPERPGTPNSGNLIYNASRYGPPSEQANSIEGVSLIWIERPKDTGTTIEVQNISTSEPAEFVLTNFTSTGSQQVREPITSEGQTILIEDEGWTINVDVTKLENPNQPNMSVELDWEIEGSPSQNDGLISSIPLIGGIADAVANVLGYIAVVITWGVTTVVEIILNVLVILVNTVSYLFGLAYFLTSTYTNIVGAAPSWASVVLTVPGVIVFAQFAKLAYLGIKAIPTT
jgi:hypothetical protein